MGKAIRIIQYLRIAAGTGLAFVLFGLGGLFLNLITLLIGVIHSSFPEKREQNIQKIVHYSFRTFFWYLKVFRLINGKGKGMEYLPSTAYILVANHPTLLDIVLVLAILPRAICVVKPEIMSSIYLGRVARTAGYITNEDGEKLVDACVKKLNQGTPIVIFPEGTRSSPKNLGRFKRSAAWIALKSDFPIVPAVMSITAPILMKDWKWYHVPPHSVEMLVDIHEPIILEKVFNNTKYDTVSARKLTSHLQQFFESKVIINDIGSDGK